MFLRLLNFIKMSWMLTWRLLVVHALILRDTPDTFIIPAALLTSGVSVFLFNITLRTWPLIRLLRKKPVIAPGDSFRGEMPPEADTPVRQSAPRIVPGKKTKEPTPYEKFAKLPTLRTATRNGKMTGFEPSRLASLPVPNPETSFRPKMVGVPGAGLLESKELDASNAQRGAEGEENFARALDCTQQLNRFMTLWSVPVPDKKQLTPAAYKADIDCIIASGNKIFLVDLKNYKSGDVRYFNDGPEILLCEDIPTGSKVGAGKDLTFNMNTATKALAGHFPHIKFAPVVVFMPTEKGEATLDNVFWPGRIPAMNLTDFIEMAKAEEDFTYESPTAGTVLRISQALLKKMI